MTNLNTLTLIPMDTIREMGRFIGERFQPEKVILFGSYARSGPTLHSDVDFLIVMNSNQPWYRRTTAIRRALSERWIEPFDLIVRSREVFQNQKDEPHTLEYEAAHDGIVLYERSSI